MKKISIVLGLCMTIVLTGCNKTLPTVKYMEDNQIDGTIIVSSLKTGKEHIINKERSEQGFLPASTFKIPNTLIALQEKVIQDENEVIEWDGKNKGFPAWNKDQTLKTAFPISCVWFYQELAKRVGEETYATYLNEMHYGNKEIGASVDTFWLEGDIKISAQEQIEFLKKVYEEEYDFDKEYYQIVKDLMIEEKTPEYILYAKTGWAQRITPQIGWYVGYVETSKDTWFFACNFEITQKSDADYRKDLVIRYLKDLKIIE